MAHNDLEAAETTYSSFISMTKVATALCALVAILVIVLIS
jgi:hypothetical protein